MGEQPADQELSPGGAENTARLGILQAVLLTSLFWLSSGGLVLFLWERPEPASFSVVPAPATATPRPTATPSPLQIEVAGSVSRPGVYQLPPGSRVQQAIEAAGDLTSEADGDAINLAQLLQDGEKLTIPARDQVAADRSTAVGPGSPVAAKPLNINTAGLQELQSLPGIGPVTAQAIVDHRQAHGPFAAIGDLVAVKGIGEGTLAKIRELVDVR